MKKFKKLFFAVAFAAAVVCSTNAMDVKAATVDANPKTEILGTDCAQPAGLTTITAQTDASESSVSVSYVYEGLDARDFEVYVSMDPNAFDFNTPYPGVSYCLSGEATVSGLQPGNTYYVGVRPYNGYGSNRQYGIPSNIFEVVTKPSGKPEIVYKGSPSTSSLNVNWSAVPGASGYVLKYCESSLSEDLAAAVVTADTGYAINGLSAGTSYTVYVYPFRASSTGYTAVGNLHGYEYDICTRPSKCSAPSVESYYRKDGYFRVSTIRKNNVKGYQYQVYTAYKKKDTKVKLFTENSYGYSYAKLQNKEFKKARLFKVRCRAYTVDSNGKKEFGKWSGWTYIGAQNSILSSDRVKGGVKFSWAKFKGANRYIVKVSTNKQSGYKKVAVTKGDTFVLKKVGKKKIKKGNKYYIKIVAQKKVGKKYITVEDPYYYTLYY